MKRDLTTENQLWNDPDWNCPHCKYANKAIRERCRNCGYDSNAGEFPYYDPLRPQLAAERTRREEAIELIKQFRQWDHLDNAADGPYWKRTIDALLAAQDSTNISNRGTK